MSVQMRRFLALFIFIFMPFFSANAVVCDVGQYTDGQYCYTCPANASCDDGVKFVCNDGWYNSGGVCTKCSVENATCTSAEDYSCLSGFYDDGKSCSACPENATCAGGKEFFYCKDGYYKFQNVSCKTCGAHKCEGEKLVSCIDGYYLYNQSCNKCQQNAYCPAGTVGSGSICKEGFFKNVGASCLECPTGYFCPLGESDYSNLHNYCASGYYRTGGSCTKCDDDVVCPGGKIEEMVCPDSLYKHDDGRCLTYAQDDCGTAPKCNPGCYDSGGICTKCSVENSTCTGVNDFTCKAGYYNNGNACILCPNNSDCPVGSTEMNCMSGYYLSGGLYCFICKDGYYCKDNVRYRCPEAVLGETLDTPPSGHIFLRYEMFLNRGRILSTSATDCKLYFLHFSGPEGEYLMNSSDYYDGSKYPINYSQTKYWATAGIGRYLSGPTTISSAVYYTKNYSCTNGPENSYYTGSGSIGGNDCPWVCNDGFYRDGNSCLVCPDGMECVGGGVICPMGMYAEKNQCMPCPSGYTDSQKSGAQSIKDCQIKCIGGTYISKSESQKCENVGEGYWIGENYTNYGATGTKNACEAGMTTIGYGAGADEADDCGRILHIGEEKVYLRQSPRTEPTLVVKYGEKKYYAHTTTKEVGRIRLGISGKVYSVYDDSMADSAQ